MLCNDNHEAASGLSPFPPRYIRHPSSTDSPSQPQTGKAELSPPGASTSETHLSPTSLKPPHFPPPSQGSRSIPAAPRGAEALPGPPTGKRRPHRSHKESSRHARRVRAPHRRAQPPPKIKPRETRAPTRSPRTHGARRAALAAAPRSTPPAVRTRRSPWAESCRTLLTNCSSADAILAAGGAAARATGGAGRVAARGEGGKGRRGPERRREAGRRLRHGRRRHRPISGLCGSRATPAAARHFRCLARAEASPPRPSRLPR